MNSSSTIESRTTGWAGAGRWLRRLVRELAIQDWLVLAYMITLVGALAAAPPCPTRTVNLYRFGGLLVWLVVGITVQRGALLPPTHKASILLYRTTMLGVVLASYFLLKDILPIVNHAAYDREIYQLDLTLFGVEPSEWLDQFVSPATTQWFSFFYYSYFILLGVYVLPMLYGARDMKLLSEFSIGFLGIYCIAHVLYMVVPGYGPYKFLAGSFEHQLPHVFWYRQVLEVVLNAGAGKDIFPSLHTAAPTFATLFAFRNRHRKPFRYVWPITGFFAANIIIATMFLRWHYVIDIVAGITLAASFAYGGPYLMAWERAWREKRGLQPLWEKLWNEPSAEPETEPEPVAQTTGTTP